jgi:hypothetical protein
MGREKSSRRCYWQLKLLLLPPQLRLAAARIRIQRWLPIQEEIQDSRISRLTPLNPGGRAADPEQAPDRLRRGGRSENRAPQEPRGSSRHGQSDDRRTIRSSSARADRPRPACRPRSAPGPEPTDNRPAAGCRTWAGIENEKGTKVKAGPGLELKFAADRRGHDVASVTNSAYPIDMTILFCFLSKHAEGGPDMG